MPKRGFRTPDFKNCLEDFDRFQTRPNYKGTFPVMKVEKPEKVVSGSSKSFSALFLENLHKKKFFEPPCMGGGKNLQNRSNAAWPFELTSTIHKNVSPLRQKCVETNQFSRTLYVSRVVGNGRICTFCTPFDAPRSAHIEPSTCDEHSLVWLGFQS